MLHGSKDKLVPYAPNVAFAQKHFSNTQFTLHRVLGKAHVFPMQETEMVKKVLLGQLNQPLLPADSLRIKD